MKKIRIGKDISLRWEITTDGTAIPLGGRDLMVEIKSPFSAVSNIPFRVDGNTIIMTYYGTEQKMVGQYSVTLWENKGKQGQNVVDAVKAFELVRTSPEEDDFSNGDIQVETIDLGTANLEVMIGSATPGGSPDLSDLQGKVDANTTSISQINAELDNKDSEIAQINTKLDEHTESIAKINTTISSHTNELSQIKTEQTEQNNSISQINNTLADHEERLVYTESDLVKIRKEYDSIISELIKSIGRTQKAFVVETNDSEGHIRIDDVNKTIPANSIKAFRFNTKFSSLAVKDPGIKSFRFLVTDTSEMTSMRYMFSQYSSLTSLDLSTFDTSAVTDMYAMFQGCSLLASIDLSTFDTSAVTTMAYLFHGCVSLKYIDLSTFDTSAVTDMYAMFHSCRSLTSLDLSTFDTSAVTNMNLMFFDCHSLTSLILGQNFFKAAAVENIDLWYCKKWTNETVVTSLVTNSYDRAAAGLNTLTIKLHANTKAALTDEQKATITNKGYTIA